MILTCPKCSMRYSASASAIGVTGRKVRCASCGHSWMVDAQGNAVDLQAAVEPAPEAIVEPEQAPVDEPQDVTESVTPPAPEEPRRKKPEVAKTLRAKREVERQQKARRRAMGIWAAIAACLMIVLGAAFMFRVNVVRLWPNTASAYAAVGMKVNRFGLEVHDLSASRQLRAGSSVLVVSGNVVNISSKPQTVPPLQAVLRDVKSGKPAFTWIVQPDQAQLPAQEKLAFSSELRDPPPDGLALEVTFTDAAPATATQKKPTE